MAGRRIALVLDETATDLGGFIAAAARDLSRRGDRVAVLGPAELATKPGFDAADATFVPLEIADRLNPAGDVKAGWALRGVLWASARGGPDVVHTFGRRAASLASVSIRRRIPLVATWWRDGAAADEDAKPGRVDAWYARRRAAELVKRMVARRAAVCVCRDSDEVAEALSMGARDARGPSILSGRVAEFGAEQELSELPAALDALYRELTGR